MIKVATIILLASLTVLSANEFRIGYYSNSVSEFSKQDLIIATDMYIREIANEIDFTAVSKIYDDPKEMAEDLANDKLDFVTAAGLVFVKHFDMSKLSNGFMEGFKDGSKESFVLVVAKNSAIKSVADLHHKIVAIQENDELIKLYIKNAHLEKHLKDDMTYELYPTRQRALLKLFFGKVDAAVVTNKTFALFTELNPQIGKKIKVLDDTHLEAQNFGFLRKSLDILSRQFMNKKAKALHKTPRGRQLLTLYKTEIIVDANLEDLKPIQELYKNTSTSKKGK